MCERILTHGFSCFRILLISANPKISFGLFMCLIIRKKVTVKPAAVLPHQALSCNNRDKTKVYDCIPLYSIGFDRTRIAWEWYCVKWDQSYQGKQQSRRVVTSGRGVPQQWAERTYMVRAKRYCRQHFSLPSAKGLERSATA